MAKQRVTFDWQDVPEDQALPSLVAYPTALPDAEPGRRRTAWALIGGMMLLLIVAAAAAQWAARQAQLGLAEIEHELTMAVDAEVWAQRTTTKLARGVDEAVLSQASNQEVKSVVVEALRPDLAAVCVITEYGGKEAGEVTGKWAEPAAVYRQLYFYHQSAEGWQPTTPQPVLWGSPETLATRYFDFVYRSRDARAVLAVAGELDALYEQIRADLGLPAAPPDRIEIRVVVGAVSNSLLAVRKGADQIVVSSPGLLHVPDSVDDTARLRQSILLHLIDRAINEAVHAHMATPQWSSLYTSMRLWEVWELGGPLSAEQTAILVRLGADLHRVASNISVPLIRNTDFCALQSLYTWGNAPVYERATAYYCLEATERDAYLDVDWEMLRTKGYVMLPPYPDFSVAGYYDEDIYQPCGFDVVLGTTMLDYVEETFGRERLGMFWSALHEYDSWETLIPALFEVTADEFKAGWQAHLIQIGVGLGDTAYAPVITSP